MAICPVELFNVIDSFSLLSEKQGRPVAIGGNAAKDYNPRSKGIFPGRSSTIARL
jgi:hypothetical protein